MLETILERLPDVPLETWQMICAMAPYLLLGFFIAGLLSIYLSAELVERHLGRGRIAGVFKASLLGVPLPLCSCGVLPVAASLRRHHAGKGATTAFLLSTPQTGVDSIFATWSLLGGVFAIFRPVVALVTGVIGGLLVSAFGGEDPAVDVQAACHAECCNPSERGNRFVRAMRYGFGTLVDDLSWALIVGFMIAGVIAAMMGDSQALEPYLGVEAGMTGLLLAMLLGLPMYVCATASIPIAAALMAAGASPGAALAFLIAGPATNAATIATVWKLMGSRTAIIYLLTVIATALGGGVLLNWVFAQPGIAMPAMTHEMLPLWAQWASAGVLLVLLVVSLVRKYRPGSSGGAGAAVAAEPGALHLHITGMTCEHCAASVRKALRACQGVSDAVVDVPGAQAHVTGTDLDATELVAAVEQAGFTASPCGGTHDEHHE